MKAPDFLITTAIGDRSRRQIWNSEEPAALDTAGCWVLEKVADGARVRDTSAKPGSPDSHDTKSVIHIPEKSLEEGLSIDFPPSASGKIRNFSFTIRPLRRIRPAYSPILFEDEGIKKKPSVLFIFYGIRGFLVRYQRTGGTFGGRADRKHVFDCVKTEQGYDITAFQDGVTVTLNGKRREFSLGLPETLTEEEVLQGTFEWNAIHWWRVNRIPIPPALPPSEEDEEEKYERATYRRTALGVSAIMAVLFVALLFGPKTPPIKVVKTVQVNLKQPLVLPKGMVKELPKPPPPPVAVAKPEPKKIAAAEPKPQPPKAAQPAPAPKPQPVAKAAAAPVRPAAPSAAQVAAQAKAKAQAQLAASLGFLSPSQNKPMANVSNAPDNTAKYNKMVSGAASAKLDSKALKNMASGGGLVGGPIDTKNARNVDSGVALSGGSGSGKSLNSVQGRVALNTLYDPNGGGEMGSSLSQKGIAMNGPGQIPESAIEKIMAKYVSKFQYCYEKALLADGSLAGNILMQWTIGPDGTSSDVKVVRSQLNNSGLHSCIIKELSKIRFPSPSGGAVTIKYPLAFSSATL